MNTVVKTINSHQNPGSMPPSVTLYGKEALSIITIWLSSSKGNRITTALEKQGCRETPLKACRNQRCASVSATWHFIFNTDTSRSISISTEIFFREPRLIYINGVLASHDLLLVKLREIGFAFYGALFFVSLRFFFA